MPRKSHRITSPDQLAMLIAEAYRWESTLSFAEIPADTEAQQILQALDQLNEKLEWQNDKLDKLVSGVNATGAQVNWITENVQGIFAMFQNPMMMNQVMGMMGGNSNDER